MAFNLWRNIIYSPFVLGICGGTASGKTTVATKILQVISPDYITFLEQDAYYKDLSHLSPDERMKVNFDHPEAIDVKGFVSGIQCLKAGHSVKKPIYDFVTHTRNGRHIELQPRPLILVEGLLIFALEQVRHLLDYKIYLDVDMDIRFIRRLKRDMELRGRSVDSIVNQYLTTVKPMEQKYVDPYRHHADLVISSDNFDNKLQGICARLQDIAIERSEL